MAGEYRIVSVHQAHEVEALHEVEKRRKEAFFVE
jgi:hypothetical protein